MKYYVWAPEWNRDHHGIEAETVEAAAIKWAEMTNDDNEGRDYSQFPVTVKVEDFYTGKKYTLSVGCEMKFYVDEYNITCSSN